MNETGWLIEHPHDPRYGRESWYAGKDGFTIDSLQAVRFARKDDALREIDRFPLSIAKELRATEHAWVGPTPGVEEMYPQQRGVSCDDAPGESEWRVKHENLLDLLAKLKTAIGVRNQEFSDSNGIAADLWCVRCEELSQEVAALEGMKNRFEAALRERDDQTNHAIRVNREEAWQAGYDRAMINSGYTTSVSMIAAERRRQVEQERYDAKHDDAHGYEELAAAGIAYAVNVVCPATKMHRSWWPWFWEEWKPTPRDPERQLVKAGALIAAAIDALSRKSNQQNP